LKSAIEDKVTVAQEETRRVYILLPKNVIKSYDYVITKDAPATQIT